MKKDIIVVGHKNPDTDSICSAISYAYLKNKLSDGKFVPMRAGEVNPETSYVLDYFNVDAPELVEDVRAQIKDSDYEKGISIHGDMSLKSAWNLLRDKGGASMTVVDDDGKVIGICSIGDIAKFFMHTQDEAVLVDSKTKYKNVADTVDGELVVGDGEEFVTAGRVIVATASTEFLQGVFKAGDMVILADKVETQKFLIESGASCMIVSLNVEIEPEVIQLAKEKGCVLIKSSNNSYTNARLLNQAVPVSHIMIKDGIIKFCDEDFIDEVKEDVAEVRHREFPIVDRYGVYKGVITKNNLIDVDKKKVILVDHNEKAQAVFGLADAEIFEIVDHHKIGHIQTMGPVFYKNMPVGCTATIIYDMFKEANVEIPKDIAGLMCSAILSDTLLFRSPTCTPLDTKAGKELAAIAGIEVEKYALDMFAAGSDFGSKTEAEIFNLDYKKFNAGDVTFGVGQVSSVSKKELDDLKEKMLAYMETVAGSGEVDMVFLMMTDILEESSDLLCAGTNALATAERAFKVEAGDRSVYLQGAVSRKKQIIPQLTAVLQ